jgi:predicted amidophosphoribosyltransferase
LRRKRWTPPQVELDEKQRAANMQGAFIVDAKALNALPRLPVVIVDDVATTGATLDECARSLRAAGVAEVFAVTIARRV